MTARSLGVAATIATAFILVGPSPVGGLGTLDVEVDGGSRLFDVDEMYPGSAAASLISVTNNATESATVGVRVTDVVSDDRGCTTPEARVDDTCDQGEGELGEQVVLTIERESDGDGLEPIVERASLAFLLDDVILQTDLGAGQTSRYRLTIELPVESGNETQSDSVEFSVEIVGELSTVAQSALADTPRLDAPVVAQLGARVATAGQLPRTGIEPARIVGVAVLSLMIGASLVVGTRRRGRVR